MTPSLSLTGGRVLAPDGEIGVRDIHIAGGLVVGAAAAGAERIDCTGYHLLPGIVDIHGDAFELELHPRPGVDIEMTIAMGSLDRQLLANGITTAFHGLTLSWEPGARSLGAARRFLEGLRALRHRLLADHRVQLRWETFALDAAEELSDWLAEEPRPAIAFNDHTTPTLEAVRAGNRANLDKWALRAGVTPEAYVAEVEAVGRRAPEVPARLRAVAEQARRQGARMLAHDEASVADRLANRALGMAISEFPFSLEVAAAAVSAGEHVVMGAPNAIRGGSHKGTLSAEEAVAARVCTILASDYYYPSLLHAAERLVARGVTTLGRAWDLVSRNPAAAMGLGDRGAIETGRRADLAVIDCAGPWRLVHTIVGGVRVSFGR